jgi:hypothetical protein
MEKLMVRIHNQETGEIIDREMNADELAQWQADRASEAAHEAAEATKAAEKAALLARLGITEEEAKLLLS